ncbi:hypothetical protein TNCV_2772371 [Trichonephila clavipes]|nr:hypothetical protein TNCV_2772371 [Trichonephila clavipes]
MRSLVVRASDSRAEDLGSMSDATKYPRSTSSLNQWVRKTCRHNHECRIWDNFPSSSIPCQNCGDGNQWCRHLSSFREFLQAKALCHICMVLKANTYDSPTTNSLPR